MTSPLAFIAIYLPSLVEDSSHARKVLVDRQVGYPIISSGTIEMVGQAFYSPAPATDDGLFFFVPEHFIY